MTTLDSIISDYSFSETEREEAFEMVARILELAADKLAAEEPTATNGIQRLRQVSRQIADYATFIEDFVEGRMNKERRKQIEQIIEGLDVNITCVDELAAEEQDYFENMPESFQSGEKGDAAQAAADALSSAKDSIQEAIDYLQEALG